MRVLLTTLALAIALAASGTVSAQPVGSPAILLSTQNYNLWIYDVQYRRAGADSWLVRIYEPQGTGPFPLLLDVHGGVWGKLDRALNEVIDQALAAGGIVVAAIDFRQAPRDPYPASVADINYATRWLKVHARDFNADPQTIGGLGMSSGGHLVMLSAMRPRDPRYVALPLTAASRVDATLGYVIALYPILDPYARYLFAQQTGRDDLIKGHNAYFQTPQAMQEGNPTLILSRGEKVEHPPTLVLRNGSPPPTAQRVVRWRWPPSRMRRMGLR
ncbi:MAG: alpha/beta hydrolase [Bacillati bacterium ANGP1]|uniref:Alpha/beta hydrolase n=1 Tax=Candidatus Segetimicrobium genomatis TaxID=2569760 RepID=A0A537JEP3_9BACT|nr:MAG: alpha/beta hydrolase [Terrabacteria group bacterium ANGP1]